MCVYRAVLVQASSCVVASPDSAAHGKICKKWYYYDIVVNRCRSKSKINLSFAFFASFAVKNLRLKPQSSKKNQNSIFMVSAPLPVSAVLMHGCRGGGRRAGFALICDCYALFSWIASNPAPLLGSWGLARRSASGVLMHGCSGGGGAREFIA